MKWSHVALNCRDLAATEEFYTKWFGFQRAREFDLGESSIVFLKSGEVYLELFGGAAVDAAGAPTSVERDGPDAVGAVRHLAFQVDDVEELLRQMGDAAQVNLGPIGFDSFIPGWKSAWITDPDGIVVEVSQGYRD